MTRRRRAVLVGSVLALLLVGADFLARFAVESSVAAVAARESDATAAEVEVRTWSALASIVLGRFDAVAIHLTSPTRNGVAVESVDLTLQDVRFRPGLGRGSGEISGSSGRAVLRMTEHQLSGPAEERTHGAVQLSFTPDGIRAAVDLGGLGRAEAEVAVDLERGELMLDLNRVGAGGRTIDVPRGLPAVGIPLPNVPPDARLEAFVVSGSTVEVRVVFGRFQMSDGKMVRATGAGAVRA